ncbi:hypothetical protein AAMO2058_000598500 [Amorphochlora amoebiformis]
MGLNRVRPWSLLVGLVVASQRLPVGIIHPWSLYIHTQNDTLIERGVRVEMVDFDPEVGRIGGDLGGKELSKIDLRCADSLDVDKTLNSYISLHWHTPTITRNSKSKSEKLNKTEKFGREYKHIWNHNVSDSHKSMVLTWLQILQDENSFAPKFTLLFSRSLPQPLTPSLLRANWKAYFHPCRRDLGGCHGCRRDQGECHGCRRDSGACHGPVEFAELRVEEHRELHGFVKHGANELISPRRKKELTTFTDNAIRLGFHSMGENGEKEQGEERTRALELLETGVTAEIGVGAGVVMRAMARVKNPMIMIKEAVVPLVSWELRERALIMMYKGLGVFLGDKLGGSPANTKASPEGIGAKKAGDRFLREDLFPPEEEENSNEESSFLNVQAQTRSRMTVKGAGDDKGFSEKAEFPGEIASNIKDIIESRIDTWVDKISPRFAKIVSSALNKTIPFAIRRRLTKEISAASNDGLISVLSRSIPETVLPPLIQKVSLYIVKELNRTLTTYITRAVTHAISASVHGAFYSSIPASCAYCQLDGRGSYNSCSEECDHYHTTHSSDPHSFRTQRSERVHYYAGHFSDYYATYA